MACQEARKGTANAHDKKVGSSRGKLVHQCFKIRPSYDRLTVNYRGLTPVNLLQTTWLDGLVERSTSLEFLNGARPGGKVYVP